MGDWPRASGARIEAIGVVTATSTGTAVSAHASANTKGSWIQVSASTPFTCTEIVVNVRFGTGINSYLIDFGVGGSGSETVLIPDLHYSGINLVPQVASFSVAIPAGSRIAARVASSTGAAAIHVAVHLISGGFDRPAPRSLVLTYGADASDSGGIGIDPGGIVHTKGAWTELTASTTRVIKQLYVDIGNQANPTATGASWLFDIGVGAASSEVIIVPDFYVSASAFETISPAWSPPLPVSVPAGSRLAVRSQCSINDASDRLLDVVLHGVT